MFQFFSLLALCTVARLVAAAPCDIYASGGTPCVAAHSTTRALFSAFTGSLYQVKRASDGATKNIAPLSAGGVANAAAQDSFCAGTTCLITIIFDQTGRSNHLTQAPPGGAAQGPEAGGFDSLAAADGAPVTLNGQKAYGVFIPPGTGYRNDATNGIATGDASEGMYAVLDGTHFNGGCCFDYGNAETSARDTGNGHMEAIYFGDITVWGSGAGRGPWIMADLENGLFSGFNVKVNTGDPSVTSRFVTAVVKGQPNNWAIRGGNAASGALSTAYNGVRPNATGYNPMKKEGAIILGIGGDNSIGAQGTFYEGVMTSGFPSDATENSVQANIVAAKYATTSRVSGPAVNVGSTVSFRATTACCTTRFIAHTGTAVNTQVVTSGSSSALKLSASWNVVTGLANSECVSFESRDTPGSFIRHFNFGLLVNANDGSKQFHEDATFCPRAGLNGQGSSLQSWSYPTRYFRHFNNVLSIARSGGPQTFDSATSFNDDISFVVGAAFA
ncbi:glycoside hydrolase family 54 protein [Mycena belliarum]|uniref:Alpha-L-arabinofuranosidase n=1 Tax=Mycena belliarum TaxID=1033014 RepID=A0AAD6TXL2_9AGAR|nr:glycoside hydrolase family 54 protein [Mycena belliae]